MLSQLLWGKGLKASLCSRSLMIPLFPLLLSPPSPLPYYLRANGSPQLSGFGMRERMPTSCLDLILPSQGRRHVSRSRMESGYNVCSFTHSSCLLGTVCCTAIPYVQKASELGAGDLVMPGSPVSPLPFFPAEQMGPH